MNAHSLRVLEYEQIKTLLAGYATCELGKHVVAGLAPSADEDAVRRGLRETSEAQRLLDGASSVPMGGIHDVREAVRAAAMGSMLEASTLLLVADTLGASRRLRAFILKREEEVPTLADRARHLGDFAAIEEEVRRCINERAEVVDEASSTLGRTRREMKVAQGRMMERLNSLLRNSAYRDMIQDPVITVRDDRYCIPVKTEYRVQFGGLVHDQSASGSTVFMEPTAVVELGNELRQLAIKERQEVERILGELSGRIGARAPEATVTLEVLGEIDFVLAKAKLGFTLRCAEPVINSTGAVLLRQARHPLLRGDVVPIDVRLGEAFNVLVITGPNTGGKTVTLKTAGLLALMAQSGLHIPAESGSTLPVFRGVFADIGDEQSIQQSLSTFSGHITNITTVLRDVEAIGHRCLVLLDELGAGTDPTEGAALAKSLLTHLLHTGVRCIATTHYGELKEFAFSNEGVENASVEFDLETLRPTYRLLIGIPGSSNAFTIAARLGLPGPIVEAARGMMGTEQATLTDVIQRLTADQRTSEADARRASDAARDVEALRDRLDREARQLRADRQDTLERARREAAEILQKARREADRALADLKRREREARRTERTTPDQARTQIQQISKRLEAAAPASPEPREALPVEETVATSDERPRSGDTVLVTTFGQQGVLLSEPVGDKAPVQVGAMRFTVPFTALRKVVPRRKPVAAPPVISNLALAARQRASSELKLLGLRAEEALETLDEYMDTACLAGLSPLRIVHGVGTGALKRVVWEYLQRHPQVERYRMGEEGEGGGGVTVVELRE
jgi:DNA mismatch repair protein MutS2